MRCAAWKSSGTVMAAASDVSLTSEMKVLDSGGTATRAACGRMVRRMVWPHDMPIEKDASHWPLATDEIAARMISDV